MQFAQTCLRVNQAGAAGSKELMVLTGVLSKRLLLAEHTCAGSRVAVPVMNTRSECTIIKNPPRCSNTAFSCGQLEAPDDSAVGVTSKGTALWSLSFVPRRRSCLSLSPVQPRINSNILFSALFY